MCERQSSASAGHCAGDGVVLVIIDGLSDVCLGDGRGGVLSRAKTPTLSALTARGQCGLLDPVSPGLTCGSDTAHLALFGYEPRGLYRGRGAFEAIGDGIDMRQGDIAFKSSFASLSGSPKDDPFGFYGNARKETKMNQNANDSPTVVSRKVEGPSLREEIVALCRVLDGTRLPSFPEVQVTVQYAMKHRCGVRLRGKHFSDMVSDTDPRVAGEPLGRSVPLDGADAEPDGSRRAEYSAAVVNEVSDVFRQILATHEVNRDRVLRQGLPPANVLLLRGASEHIHVAEPFEARHGLSAFLIAPTKIIAGVGVTVGLPIVFAPGATGDYQTDYNSKADTCVHTMLTKSDVASDRWRYDVGIVHVKAVDDAGHDGDYDKKLIHLEAVDGMISRIVEGLRCSQRRGVRIMVTGDHSTAISLADHTCEPVPLVVAPVAFGSGGNGDTIDADTGISSATYNKLSAESADGYQWVPDATPEFDEAAIGVHGCLGRFPGLELMRIVKYYAGVDA